MMPFALLTATLLAATPFKPYSIVDATIDTPRSLHFGGWQIEALAWRSGAPSDTYGYVLDAGNQFVPSAYWGIQTFALSVRAVYDTIKIQNMDKVSFTYLTEKGGGWLTLDVLLPALTKDIVLFVDTDGLTYTDPALAQLAVVTPTSTPVPTKTPTPSPSPTQTPTPPPSPTPGPNSANIKVIEGTAVFVEGLFVKLITPTPVATPIITPTP